MLVTRIPCNKPEETCIEVKFQSKEESIWFYNIFNYTPIAESNETGSDLIRQALYGNYSTTKFNEWRDVLERAVRRLNTR